MKKAFTTKTLDDNTCILTFDTPGTCKNILNEDILNDLNDELARVENNPSLEALIIKSAKAKTFIDGADLPQFEQGKTLHDIQHIIELGQKTFNRIANLKITTIAAIHGACLGGGMELTLACDYRIASNDKSTKLGLHEIHLGILPIWGASTRLPRIIGLPNALKTILDGKHYSAAQAERLGLIDSTVFHSNLINSAIKKAHTSKPRKNKFHFINLPPIVKFIKKQALKNTLIKTYGNYPAPIKAIEVITESLSTSLDKSLINETEAILELIKTEASRNMMNSFFLEKQFKKLNCKSKIDEFPKTKNIAVIGAGVMGSGISQIISTQGKNVLLKDVNRDALARGIANIRALFTKAVTLGILTKIEATSSLDRIIIRAKDVPMKNIQMVIEAVPEEAGLKKKIFKDLEEHCPEDVILASSTSALSITEMASGLSRPENIIGMHFLNSAHSMKLVEIVKGKKTSSETIDRSIQFIKETGKLPIIVNDKPGFLINRILMPYLMEAVKLFEVGVDIQTIDNIMLKFGMPMGPISMIDEIGLDNVNHVTLNLSKRLDNIFAQSYTLEDMINNGWLGKKSGQGFYIYSYSDTPIVNEQIKGLLKSSGTPVPNDEEIEDRLILLMINEATRCLHENVVSNPSDVDFGMTASIKWAPFRGGPLRHADSLKIRNVLNRLYHYKEELGDHFTPSPLLIEMANNDRSFYTD